MARKFRFRQLLPLSFGALLAGSISTGAIKSFTALLAK